MKRKKQVPMRRCVGCMESKPKKELIRIACYEGVIHVDPEGKRKGRGIYVCRALSCMEAARKKNALARGFHCRVDREMTETVFRELEQYAE